MQCCVQVGATLQSLLWASIYQHIRPSQSNPGPRLPDMPHWPGSDSPDFRLRRLKLHRPRDWNAVHTTRRNRVIKWENNSQCEIYGRGDTFLCHGLARVQHSYCIAYEKAGKPVVRRMNTSRPRTMLDYHKRAIGRRIVHIWVFQSKHYKPHCRYVCLFPSSAVIRWASRAMIIPWPIVMVKHWLNLHHAFTCLIVSEITTSRSFLFSLRINFIKCRTVIRCHVMALFGWPFHQSKNNKGSSTIFRSLSHVTVTPLVTWSSHFNRFSSN